MTGKAVMSAVFAHFMEFQRHSSNEKGENSGRQAEENRYKRHLMFMSILREATNHHDGCNKTPVPFEHNSKDSFHHFLSN